MEVILWIWVFISIFNMTVFYVRCRLLNDYLEMTDIFAMLIIIWCPIINFISLILLSKIAIRMIFDLNEFKLEHMEPFEAKQYQLRSKYALEFLERKEMLSDLDDFIDAKLLIGKLSQNPEEE